MLSKSWLVLPCAAALAACQASSQGSASGSGEAGGATKTAAKGKSSEGGGIGGILKALKPEPVVIPAGTDLPLVFETTVSSGTSSRGDAVLAKLASDVRVGEKVVLPEGTEVRGRVTTAVPSGRVKGLARLAVSFDTVVHKGKEHPIETRTIDITAPKTHKKDATIIGGGAAAGAIVGAIAGGKKGAAIGTAVGAGAGAGTVLATKGKEVTLGAGATRTVELTADARLE